MEEYDNGSVCSVEGEEERGRERCGDRGEGGTGEGHTILSTAIIIRIMKI